MRTRLLRSMYIPLKKDIKKVLNHKRNMKREQPIIVGLDIGTTKVAAIAGRKNRVRKAGNTRLWPCGLSRSEPWCGH